MEIDWEKLPSNHTCGIVDGVVDYKLRMNWLYFGCQKTNRILGFIFNNFEITGNNHSIWFCSNQAIHPGVLYPVLGTTKKDKLKRQ